MFAEPWEAQAFALAVKLSEQGYFTWKEWAAALGHELQAAADRGEPDMDGSQYYQHWLAALERLVTEKELTDRAALAARKNAWADAYRDTPHGQPVYLTDSPELSRTTATSYRQQVTRADGRVVDLLLRRAHIAYCFSGCCCGRTDRGYAPVPATTFKDEWVRRKLRKVVHLTKAGCLGPCELANVASVVFDGHAVWFHSVNGADEVCSIFDYVEQMVAADQFLPIPNALSALAFNYYDWDLRDARRREETVSDVRADVQHAIC